MSFAHLSVETIVIISTRAFIVPTSARSANLNQWPYKALRSMVEKLSTVQESSYRRAAYETNNAKLMNFHFTSVYDPISSNKVQVIDSIVALLLNEYQQIPLKTGNKLSYGKVIR